MKSWNEIQKMNKEQLAAENSRLVKKLVLTKIVLPIAVTAAVYYGLKYLFNEEDTVNED
jgi:multisubunit Na+/H+ antiporter MnhC subunit